MTLLIVSTPHFMKICLQMQKVSKFGQTKFLSFLIMLALNASLRSASTRVVKVTSILWNRKAFFTLKIDTFVWGQVGLLPKMLPPVLRTYKTFGDKFLLLHILIFTKTF